MENLVIKMIPKYDFWKNKKVFLTGHTGFKGSWTAIWLSSLGAEVKGYSLEPLTNPNLFDLAKIDKILDSEINDIYDYNNLSNSILTFKPEIVFHMAAQPLVRKSYLYPIDTFKTNILGTANLLEIVRKCKSVKSVINVTSDKCYKNEEKSLNFKESDPMGGDDPYSASKACAELISTTYRKSFLEKSNIGLATVRAVNVIGGGDWSEDRLIPDLLKSFSVKKNVLIRNPNATRPWQHVLEPILGYLLLAEKLYEEPYKFSGGWNFGPKNKDIKKVSWIADEVSTYFPNSKWLIDNNDHPNEANELQLDVTKAQKELGWSPTWNIKKAISKIIDWQNAYKSDKKDIYNICQFQIESYINDIGEKNAR